MKHTILSSLMTLFLMFDSYQDCNAAISIDSVSIMPSSCTNNGSAVVYATSSTGLTLLYQIVAGPVLSGLQNSNIFSSLFPGSYTARVYDVNFDSTETQFQISGNYQLPNFTLLLTDPVCPTSSDGSIAVEIDTTVGLAPFLYEMTSPTIIPQQTQNVFPGLNTNTYFIRVTDACGNYQTRTGVLSGSGTGITFNTFNIPSLVKIGCDTMEMTDYFYLYKEKASLPLTLTLSTSSGTTTKTITPIVIDTTISYPGVFKFIDTIPNLTYGDFLQFSLTDVCGEGTYSALNQVAPFDFEVLFSGILSNCMVTFAASLILKQYYAYPYDFTVPMSPVTFTLVDIATNTVVDSMINVPFSSVYLKPETGGTIYQLTVTDGCGQVWQQNIQWPTAGVPSVITYTSPGCLDSTAVITFEHHNFQSAVTLTFLSGPTIAQSAKPFYTYSYTVTYPRIFTGINSNYIYIRDFPAGTYTYQIEDSCGNVIQGTLILDPAMVSNLHFTWYVKPSCLNNNTLFYNFQEGTGGAVYASITDLATGTLVSEPILNYVIDSVYNLSIGQYALEIYYTNHNGTGAYFDGSILGNNPPCWILYDTISIVPYTNNSFITNNTIFCNGTNYVEIIVDSTRGVPPYKFEIISGPQIFAQQDSGIFQINLFGNYVVSLEDACGNNYTQQITLSSDSFPPIIKNGFLCTGQDVVLSAISSSHFTYIWHYPNGTTFTGDSIGFHPFSASDTGLYQVTKIVNINGCNDSLFSSYYLTLNEIIPLFFPICEGDTIYVGSNAYTLPGIYVDSLSSILGCDSIIISTITLAPLAIDSNMAGICKGDSIVVGTNSYYLAGTYNDTITLPGGCKKLIVTQLTINSSVDSLNASVCTGDSIAIGGVIYSLPGTYEDTLVSSLGCDSTIVITIVSIPLVIDSNTVTICKGDSVTVGNNSYFSAGTYTDTVASAGVCKKIIVTQVSVNFNVDSLNAVLCQGDSLTLNNVVYYQPGIYTDTLVSALGCDSILILNIGNMIGGSSVLMAFICEGDSFIFRNKYYMQSGIFADTIPTSGCDSVAILNLTVDSYPVFSIGVSNDTILSGSSVQLSCSNTLATSYSWSGNAAFSNTGSSSTNATVIASGWIYLSVTSSNGCTAFDSVYIYVTKDDGDTCDYAVLFIPNTFTPNNDGRNDLFKIVSTSIHVKSVLIFNRWGEKIFESSTYKDSWDGTYRNTWCPQGVYYYVVQYENCLDGSIQEKHGSLMLMQ